jgi:2-dehydropantoate 2-reductase
MKICIYGAGAIGGFIGAQLAADESAGHQVSAVARGATLAALRKQGLRLQLKDRLLTARVRAEQNPEALGAQDLVVLAVKAPALPEVARHIAPLIGKDTMVLTAMNGVPWWFFHGFGGKFEGTPLAAIDPDGSVAAAIPAAQIIGCVVHATCTVTEPGLVKHGFGQRLIIGEPAGCDSARLQKLAAVLRGAGFESETSDCIQRDIWYKLWGNMTMNPVSAFTGASSDRVLDDALVTAFCHAVMREAADIGAKIGCPIAQTPEDRHLITRKLGSFKTSMLQDVEAGKAVEIDALLTVVREIGLMAGVVTPNLDALLGLSRLHARVHGLYPLEKTQIA